jgi:hypothetical protein
MPPDGVEYGWAPFLFNHSAGQREYRRDGSNYNAQIQKDPYSRPLSAAPPSSGVRGLKNNDSQGADLVSL